jgi:hypothetical protein
VLGRRLTSSPTFGHVALAALGVWAEGVAAAVDVSDGAHFTALRRRTREALQLDGVLGEIDEAVCALLDHPAATLGARTAGP